MTPDAEVDALGLLCPLPVIRAAAAAGRLPAGALLAVLADDPDAPADLEAWCAGNGHRLEALESLPEGAGKGGWRALIRLRP